MMPSPVPLSPLPIPPAPGRPAAYAGGWRPGLAEGCRHGEIFAPADEASGAALALALALDGMHPAAASGAGANAGANLGDHPDQRPWLWVQDKAAVRLGGRPYHPGLPHGLRHRLVHVAAAQPEDALFAIEEGVRCRDLAFVVGEIAGNPRALGLTASRRLSLAAERHGVPVWLVRLGARRDLGSARMRWEARAAPSHPPRWNPQAPGAAAWDAELFRAHALPPGRWVLRDQDGLVAEPATERVLRQDQHERGPVTESGPLTLSLSKGAR